MFDENSNKHSQIFHDGLGQVYSSGSNVCGGLGVHCGSGGSNVCGGLGVHCGSGGLCMGIPVQAVR